MVQPMLLDMFAENKIYKKIAQTNKIHTFYLQQRSDNGFTWADIKVNHPLDYESIKEYNLTIRVENNGAQQLASEATVYIMLEDVNDEIPLFTEREQETVLEGEPIGTKVTQVNAIDKDGTFPNNQHMGAIHGPLNQYGISYIHYPWLRQAMSDTAGSGCTTLK
ncbi:unnamed protein product, partial [Nesidiocoris tenuis]